MDTHMRLLGVAFSLLLAFVSNAQQWCVPGATWHYTAGWNTSSFYTYNYYGDTLLDGITGNLIRSNYNNGPWHPTGWITRAEDDVVFTYQGDDGFDGAWDTLIWYGAVPGDHWNHIGGLHMINCWCPFNVVDTGHVELDGEWLRTIEVTNPCFNGDWPYSYIERIGSDVRLFLMECEQTDFFHEPQLRCYSDTGMTYISGLTPTCDQRVGLNGTNVSTRWSIHPAGEGSIRIQRPEALGRERLRFIDATGRTVLTRTVNAGDVTVDVSQLATGSYIVQPATRPELVPLRWIKY